MAWQRQQGSGLEGSDGIPCVAQVPTIYIPTILDGGVTVCRWIHSRYVPMYLHTYLPTFHLVTWEGTKARLPFVDPCTRGQFVGGQVHIYWCLHVPP